MRADVRKPGADGEFAMAEDPHGRPDAQAFGQGAEHLPDTPGRGFEAVQGRDIANAELCPTGLALEIPDVLQAAVAATADERVDLVIRDAVAEAVGVGAGIARGDGPFSAAGRVLDLGIRFGKARCRRAD